MKWCVYFTRGMISMLSDIVVIVFCLQFSQNSLLLTSMMERIYEELQAGMEAKLIIFKKDAMEEKSLKSEEKLVAKIRYHPGTDIEQNHKYVEHTNSNAFIVDYNLESRTSKKLPKPRNRIGLSHKNIGHKSGLKETTNAKLGTFRKCSQKRLKERITSISIIDSHIGSINEDVLEAPVLNNKIESNSSSKYINYSQFSEADETSHKQHSNFKTNLTSTIKLLNARITSPLPRSTSVINVTPSKLNPHLFFQDPKMLMKIICKMRKFYGGLLKSLKILNEALNPLLLLQMTVLIICLVLNAYLVVQFLISSEENAMFFLSLTRLVVHALSVLYLLMYSEHLYRTIELFFKRLHVNPPMFSASGLFNLTIGILGSILSAIITYVLVALQFRVIWKDIASSNSTNYFIND